MTVRRVPLDKLFLQPRVHLQWLRQAGQVRFEVGEGIADRFGEQWRQYEQAGCPPPASFLDEHPLTEDEPVFALFAGAVYARAQEPDFWLEIETDVVAWHTEPE